MCGAHRPFSILPVFYNLGLLLHLRMPKYPMSADLMPKKYDAVSFRSVNF